MNPWLPEELQDNMASHQPQCPGCGLHRDQLLHGGSIGCGMCLHHFRQFANQLVAARQGGEIQHRGSWPEDRGARMQARVQVYREAIQRAQKEGRIAEVETLSHLLTMLLRDIE